MTITSLLHWKPWLAGALLACLSACASFPPREVISPAATPQAQALRPVLDPATGEYTLTLSALTYNVAGLPWPRRTGTGAAIRRIEDAWAEEFAQPPDIVLLQEAFVASAARLPQRVGYANMVRGPTRRLRAERLIEPPSAEFRQGRRLMKGERLGRVVGSGLMLATQLPIGEIVRHPFGKGACAGYDCLANKGVLLVQIDIPELPEPLFILNTHLNSRGSAGVSEERSLYAYRRQLDEIAALLERDWRGRGPLIWVGDFNARGALDRFTAKDARMPGDLAHRYCVDNEGCCRIAMSWDNDAPWLDTQDLQGFADGLQVRVRPVAIAARFDRPRDGRMLSDHDGLEVTWELRWPATTLAGEAERVPASAAGRRVSPGSCGRV